MRSNKNKTNWEQKTHKTLFNFHSEQVSHDHNYLGQYPKQVTPSNYFRLTRSKSNKGYFILFATPTSWLGRTTREVSNCPPLCTTPGDQPVYGGISGHHKAVFFFPVTFFYARDIPFLRFVTGIFAISRAFFWKLSRAFWKCHGHRCHGHMSRALFGFLRFVTGILKMSRALFVFFSTT